MLSVLSGAAMNRAEAETQGGKSGLARGEGAERNVMLRTIVKRRCCILQPHSGPSGGNSDLRSDKHNRARRICASGEWQMPTRSSLMRPLQTPSAGFVPVLAAGAAWPALLSRPLRPPR